MVISQQRIINGLEMKRSEFSWNYILGLGLTLMFFGGCNSFEKNEYFDFWKWYSSDTVSTIYYSKKRAEREFRLKKLDGFAKMSNYDFYIVYNFNAYFYDTSVNKSLLITIKTADSIGYISYDEIETFRNDDFFWEESNSKTAQKHFLMKGISTITDANRLLSFKVALDSTISHLPNFPESHFNDGGSDMMYYDGKKYHKLTLDIVGLELQRKLDSLIINDQLFDSLLADFYYKSLLYRIRIKENYVKRPDSLSFFQRDPVMQKK